jgi:hypothetical protein
MSFAFMFGLENESDKQLNALFRVDHDAFSRARDLFVSRSYLRVCGDRTFASLQRHTKRVLTMAFWYFMTISMTYDYISVSGDHAN